MFISYTFAMKIYLVRKNLKSCKCIDKTCDSGSWQRQGVKNYSLLSLIVIYHTNRLVIVDHKI